MSKIACSEAAHHLELVLFLWISFSIWSERFFCTEISGNMLKYTLMINIVWIDTFVKPKQLGYFSILFLLLHFTFLFITRFSTSTCFEYRWVLQQNFYAVFLKKTPQSVCACGLLKSVCHHLWCHHRRNNSFVVKVLTFCSVPVMLWTCERGQGFTKD